MLPDLLLNASAHTTGESCTSGPRPRAYQYQGLGSQHDDETQDFVKDGSLWRRDPQISRVSRQPLYGFGKLKVRSQVAAERISFAV
jgi:hypothetical protein